MCEKYTNYLYKNWNFILLLNIFIITTLKHYPDTVAMNGQICFLCGLFLTLSGVKRPIKILWNH